MKLIRDDVMWYSTSSHDIVYIRFVSMANMPRVPGGHDMPRVPGGHELV